MSQSRITRTRAAYGALALFVGVSLLSPWLFRIQVAQLIHFAVVLAIACVLFHQWSRRPLLAVVLASGLLACVDQIDRVKLRMLAQPLMASDLTVYCSRSLQNMETLWQYPVGMLVTLGGVCALILVIWAGIKHEPPQPAEGLWARPWFRLVCSLFVLCGAFRLWWWSNEDLLEPGPKRILTQLDDFVQDGRADRTRERSNLLQFIRSFAVQGLWSPGATASPELFRSRLVQSPELQSTRGKPLPDICLILNESFIDPRRLQGYEGEAMPLLEEHPKDARSSVGTLRVHSFGGGTWLAEFAAMTGWYWAEFGPSGAYAPYMVSPRINQALAHHMRKLGYRTVAILPVSGYFMGIKQSFFNYGFEEVYDAEDLGFPSEWSTVSDELVFRASERFVAGTGKPLFLYIDTLQNHGPHGVSSKSGLDFPPGFEGCMEDYLSRLRSSNRPFQSFIDRWLASAEPRMLCFFGDHYPSFGGLMLNARIAGTPDGAVPDPGFWYRTPYVVRANFELKKDALPESVDLAYLPSVLLDAADLPPGPYFHAQGVLRRLLGNAWVESSDREMLESYFAYVRGELRVCE